MYELKKSYEFDVKEQIKVNYQSKNLPLKIEGTDQSKAFLTINITSQNEYEEDKISCEYDKDQNYLNIDFTNFENETKIKKSDIELKIPYKADINLSTENGKLIIYNLEGEQIIKKENGLIKIEKLVGNLKVNTENAMLTINDFKGKLFSKSENAMISLKQIKGDISTTSKNGLITLTQSQGVNLKCKNENGLIRITKSIFENVFIKNTNGSIYYQVSNTEPANINIKNQRGKIKIKIQKDTQFDIVTKTIRGNFHFDLQASMESGKEEDYKVAHLVRGGGFVKLSLINEIGNITVSDKDSASQTSKLGNIISSFFQDNIFAENTSLSKEKFKQQTKELIQKSIEEAEKKAKQIFNENSKIITKTGEELSQKVIKSINELLNKTFEKIKEKEKTNDEEVKKRSRMKILQMLQDKKITAEQAEKLLNALEDSDE